MEYKDSSIVNTFGKLGYIGIRREDKSKWERRAPLTPAEVKQLTERHSNLKFFIEPSTLRVFKDIEYKKAGATITSDLSKCSLILGVKEIPTKSLMNNKTYMFFSHVIKAQEHNMAMLDDILVKQIRLVDYEKITDDTANRLVAFGKFAGNAGTIDFLSGLGKYFLNKGYSTPFLNISMSYTYYNLAKAKESMTSIKPLIENEGIPKEFCPLVFAITSKGRVSSGTREILECLPIKIIDRNELMELVRNKNDIAQQSVIYVTYIEPKDLVKPLDEQKNFDKQDYYANPDKYVPCFHEKYLPYISCIFHCMYWDPKFQRMITIDQMKKLVQEKKSRLLGICDITCDIEGSIEFLKRYTSIDNPFYLYNPITEEVIDDVNQPSNEILYHAVDHLPTELALDSSNHFGKQLSPFIENLAMSDITRPFEQQGLVNELSRAVITWNGSLTEAYSYIKKLRLAREEMKRKPLYNVKGPSKLVRDISFTSIKLEGHLFDTMAINKIFDELEKVKVEFRVLDLEIGKRNGKKSFAYIQIFSKDRKMFGLALEKITELSQQYNLTLLD